ncbi:MAG: amidohydrolase family protein [Dehalococcoidia bacterium]
MAPSRYHLSATVLPDGDAPVDLWVVDGRLSFTAVDGAEELAPADGFVIAGLVDCHVHLALDAGRVGLPLGSPALIERSRQAHLVAGTLLLRDVGTIGEATRSLSRDDGLPYVSPAGGFLAPPGRYFEFGQFVTEAQLVEAALLQVTAGARWVKVIGDWREAPPPDGSGRLSLNFSTEALTALVSAAHAAGARVAVHTTGHEGAAAAVAAGVDSIEHGMGLDESLLAAMAEKGLAWTPTVAQMDAVLRTGNEHGAARARERLDQMAFLLPRAAKLGIPILAGTDTLPPGSVAREVAALLQYGLDPRTALAAASTAARRFLGEPALDAGAFADLVVYTADPRNDPELLARPSLVMLRGRLTSGEAA